MNGVEFSFLEENNTVIATVSPGDCDATLEAELVKKAILKSEFSKYYIKEDAINSLVVMAKNASGAGKTAPFTATVAEIKDAEVKVQVSNDAMEASVIVVGAYSGKPLKLANFQQALATNGVIRGWSSKRISALVEKADKLAPGRIHKEVIAKGLPPRKGRNSRIKPLVENALERVLQPKKTEDDKVDMRDLGEIICVKKGEPVAEVLPPSPGRSGFTVTNMPIKPEPGDDLELKLGANTTFDKMNKRLVVACIDGLPKFAEGVMAVDDTFVSKGVNVRTGNVDFDGAVIVNGDVTENMKITASGDVTINGFVESATIIAQGDIVITQGVLGKPDGGKSCKLIAKGDVAVAHAQGVNIEACGEVRVMKQIAHSDITCFSKIFVGRGDKPNGSIFGCVINAYSAIEAGSVGAVSGSKLDIDFSEGFNKISQRLEGLREMRKELAKTNADHEIQYAQFKNRVHNEEVQQKVKTLEQALEEERELLQWLQTVEQDNMDNLSAYKDEVKVIARQTLYPGVSVKLNKQSYTSDKENTRACLFWHDHEWKVTKTRA